MLIWPETLEKGNVEVFWNKSGEASVFKKRMIEVKVLDAAVDDIHSLGIVYKCIAYLSTHSFDAVSRF